MTVADRAARILRELWPSDRPRPVLRVRVWRFPWASGSARVDRWQVAISVPSDVSDGLLRLVVAHEVAHLLSWAPRDQHGPHFWERLAEVLELAGVAVRDLRTLPKSARDRDSWFKSCLTTLTT